MNEEQTIVIDVVSDVMCPWCFIGKKRLESALREIPEIPVAVRWRPFQLDATLPHEGKDRQAYLNDKFGGRERAAEIYSRIKSAGAGDGIDFQFDKITKSPNTLDCHRLILWARADGLEDKAVQRLFEMYFLEGVDLSVTENLVAVAREIGMDAERVAERLATDEDLDRIKTEIESAHQMGVNGVPCVIIDERFALMGAETPETIVAAIKHAKETKPGAAA
ncbi:thioredoxin domain-containing protein [Stappia sp. GBMRC 2046]|uniref:Thioredoxin domain-containing protein n=1 Tax=Stappia sediminis TaxID=2692190 RepID=A0A7X3LT20_9HYPH|nr:DsbA family oxidoreductase [Stappia sediminis]MXN64602.1 thioredoxin domain-containing protein [Stappia sediminis]